MHPQRSLLVALLFVAGCDVVDVDRLTTHMVDRCHVAPPVPACALANENADGLKAAMSRFAATSVTTSTTEACLLAVDCSVERRSDDTEGMIADLNACLDADPSRDDQNDDLTDVSCWEACHTSLIDCRDHDDACGPIDVLRCIDAFEQCALDR